MLFIATVVGAILCFKNIELDTLNELYGIFSKIDNNANENCKDLQKKNANNINKNYIILPIKKATRIITRFPGYEDYYRIYNQKNDTTVCIVGLTSNEKLSIDEIMDRFVRQLPSFYDQRYAGFSLKEVLGFMRMQSEPAKRHKSSIGEFMSLQKKITKKFIELVLYEKILNPDQTLTNNQLVEIFIQSKDLMYLEVNKIYRGLFDKNENLLVCIVEPTIKMKLKGFTIQYIIYDTVSGSIINEFHFSSTQQKQIESLVNKYFND